MSGTRNTRLAAWMLPAGLALLLSGCSEHSACPEQDWQQLGKQEASAGQEAAWPQAGCPADAQLASYLQGRQEGATNYCQPQQGWQDALAGTAPLTECDAVGRGTYLQGWHLGEAMHGFRQRIIAIEAELESVDDEQAAGRLRRELRQIQNDIEAIRGAATVEGWVGG